jgi:hypothetical protein
MIRRKIKKRIVLMLLEWVADGRAERRGLLSDYRSQHDSELLKHIPRMRSLSYNNNDFLELVQS